VINKMPMLLFSKRLIMNVGDAFDVLPKLTEAVLAAK